MLKHQASRWPSDYYKPVCDLSFTLATNNMIMCKFYITHLRTQRHFRKAQWIATLTTVASIVMMQSGSSL